MRTPEAKALIGRFLALPQVSLALPQSIWALMGANLRISGENPRPWEQI